MSTGDEEFLTVADVARVLKLNQQTVRNWIDGRMLPPLRVGSRVRVRRTPTPVAALGEAVVTPASCLRRGDGGAHERHRQAAM